jgi:cyclopropane fatty-acyl-phospholipid synthase-like methyltransferase
MSIISVSSTNPNFSFVIQKNPESKIKLQTLRLGVAVGWFSKENSTYNIFFKDAEDEVSYKVNPDEQFEYLDLSRYNSSLFIINAVDDFLRSAYKTRDESIDADGYENSFYINMLGVKNDRYIKAFANYFPEYKMDYQELVSNNFRINISTQKSLYELLNFVALFANFIAIVNNENLHIKEENVAKNIACLNIVDAPYFVRYLFKLRFLFSENKFRDFKTILEKSERSKIELVFGDNWIGRQDFVENKLSFNDNVLDIGCGEGKYITKLSNNVRHKKYFAIDKDKEVLDDAKRRVKNKGLDNVLFFESLDAYLLDHKEEPVEVILSEVIEHMEYDEAKELVIQILKNVKFSKIVITTPDSRFNSNYFMSEKFRHDDHKFEFNRNEFIEFMTKCIAESGMLKQTSYLFEDVGDVVDGISTTQACIVSSL